MPRDKARGLTTHVSQGRANGPPHAPRTHVCVRRCIWVWRRSARPCGLSCHQEYASRSSSSSDPTLKAQRSVVSHERTSTGAEFALSKGQCLR